MGLSRAASRCGTILLNSISFAFKSGRWLTPVLVGGVHAVCVVVVVLTCCEHVHTAGVDLVGQEIVR